MVGREGPVPSDETRSAGGRETRSQQSGQLLHGRSYLIGESLMAIAPIPIIGCLLNRPTLEHMPTIPKPGSSLGHFPYSIVNLCLRYVPISSVRWVPSAILIPVDFAWMLGFKPPCHRWSLPFFTPRTSLIPAFWPWNQNRIETGPRRRSGGARRRRDSVW